MNRALLRYKKTKGEVEKNEQRKRKRKINGYDKGAQA